MSSDLIISADDITVARMIGRGIHTDVEPADYYSDPCPQPSLTQSIAKILLRQSPMHARREHPRLSPSTAAALEYSRPMAIGTVAHRLVLGRGQEFHLIDADDFRKKDTQDARDHAIENGLVPILAPDHATAALIASKVRQQLDAMNLTATLRSDGGASEVMLAWDERGIWFRSLIDWMGDGGLCCVDLKTTAGSAAPHAIARKIADDGWHIQAAFHERGLDALDPEGAGRRRFLFVAIEQQEPYALSVHELDEAWMTIGRREVDIAQRVWRQCMQTGEWPDYADRIWHPDVPAWLERDAFAREIVFHVKQGAPMLTSLAGG